MLTSHFKFLKIAFRPEDGEGGESAEAATETEVETEAEAPEAQAPAPQMVPVDIMQRRIAALTRQKADLERQLELERLDKEVSPRKEPKTAVPPDGRPDIMSEAQIIAENLRREEKAQAVLSAGQAQNKNFLQEVQNMSQVLGQLPNHFLDAVMEAGDSPADSAALLFNLSQDLNLAGQILAQSPTKMAVSLANLVSKAKTSAPPPPNPKPSAPAPIKPKVGGGGSSPASVQISDTKSPISDWMAERERTARKVRRY